MIAVTIDILGRKTLTAIESHKRQQRRLEREQRAWISRQQKRLREDAAELAHAGFGWENIWVKLREYDGMTEAIAKAAVFGIGGRK